VLAQLTLAKSDQRPCSFISGIYRSAHQYKDAEDPSAPPRHVHIVHPLVRLSFKTEN
jgi:hypothetical protein